MEGAGRANPYVAPREKNPGSPGAFIRSAPMNVAINTPVGGERCKERICLARLVPDKVKLRRCSVRVARLVTTQDSATQEGDEEDEEDEDDGLEIIEEIEILNC